MRLDIQSGRFPTFKLKHHLQNLTINAKIQIRTLPNLELFHGVFKIPVEEQELRELRERLEKFEEIPSVFILPKMPGEF